MPMLWLVLLLPSIYALSLSLPTGGGIDLPNDPCSGIAAGTFVNLGVFFNASGLPIFKGIQQANCNLSLICDGTTWTSWQVSLSTRTQIDVFGDSMAFAGTTLFYDSSSTLLSASLDYNSITLDVDLTLQPLTLKSFSIMLKPGKQFKDLGLKSWQSGLQANGQTSSDLVRWLNQNVNYGFIRYKESILSFGAGVTNVIPNAKVDVEARMALNTTGTNLLTGKFDTSTFSFVGASMVMDLKNSFNVSVEISGQGGLCANTSTITAQATIPASPTYGLTSPLDVTGSLSFFCDPIVKNQAKQGQPITGFQTSLQASTFNVSFFEDADPLTCSGSFRYNSKTGTWLLDGTISNARLMLATSTSVVPSKLDSSFELLVMGAVRMGDLPIVGKLIQGSTLADYQVSGIQVGLNRSNLLSNSLPIVRESLSARALSVWLPDSKTSMVTTVQLSSLRNNGTWALNAEIVAVLNIGTNIQIKGSISGSKALDNARTIEADITGNFSDLGVFVQPSFLVTGSLRMITADGLLSSSENQSRYEVQMRTTTPLQFNLMGGKSARLETLAMTFNNTRGILDLSCSLGNANAKFNASASINVKPGNSTRALQKLKMSGRISSFADLPIKDGLNQALSSSDATSLLSDKNKVSGSFDFSWSSGLKNGLLTDRVSINASIETRWFLGDARLSLRRALPPSQAFNGNGQSWDLESAKLYLATQYANVTVAMDGPPCDVGTLLTFSTSTATFPMIKSFKMNGIVKFDCTIVKNVSTITGMTANATTAMTLDVFNTNATINANVIYYKPSNKNATWSFYGKTKTNSGTGLLVQGNWTNSTNFGFLMAGQSVRFGRLPYWKTLATYIPIVSSLQNVTVDGVNFKYQTFAGNSVVNFTVASSSQKNSLDTNIQAILKRTRTGNWTAEVKAEVGLYIADVDANIKFSLAAATCSGSVGGISTSFNSTFNSMPSYLPKEYNGILSIPCINGKAAYSNFTLIVQLPQVNLGTALGIGSNFNLKNVELRYYRALSKFAISHTMTSIGFTSNLELGYGVRSPFGVTQTNPQGSKLGYRLWGTFDKNLTISDVISKVGQMLGITAENPLTTYKLSKRQSSQGQEEIQKLVEGAKFDMPIVDVNPTNPGVTVRAGVNAWGLKAHVMFTAQKSSGKWVFAFGIVVKVPTDPAQLNLMPSWLRSLVAYDGFQVDSMFLGFSTDTFTINIPDDDGVSVPPMTCNPTNQQCLFNYAQQMTTVVPNTIKFDTKGVGIFGKIRIKSGPSNMRDFTSKTGMFGSSLSNSGNLGFGIILTPSDLTLSISFQIQTGPQDLNGMCTAGSRQSRRIVMAANQLLQQRGLDTREQYPCSQGVDYTGLALQLKVGWGNSASVSFYFVFDVTRSMNGKPITFKGGIGLSLSTLGVGVEGFFNFNGEWINPLGLSQQLTVSKAGLQLGMNLNTLAPYKFGLNVLATMNSRFGTSIVNGCVFVDLTTFTANGNALYLNATNVNLAVWVYGFLPGLPDGIAFLFQPVTIDSLVASVNPSIRPVTLQNCGLTVKAGIFIDVKNFKFLWGLLTVERASFEFVPSISSPIIQAQLQLAPVDLFGVVRITSFNDTSKGAMAKFYASRSMVSLDFSAKVSIIGITAGAQVSFLLDSTQFNLKIDATLNFFNIDINLYISTIISQSQSSSFALRFSISATDKGSILTAIARDLVSKVTAVVTGTFDTLTSVSKQVSNEVNNWAMTRKAEAQIAFDAVRKKVQAAFDSARQTVSGWQGDLQGLKDKYLYYKKLCEDSPWWRPDGYCIRTGYYWTIYNAANLVLEGVKIVISGVQYGVEGALDVAQTAYNAVLDLVNLAVSFASSLIELVANIVKGVLEFITNGILALIDSIISIYNIDVDTIVDKDKQDFTASVELSLFGGDRTRLSLTISLDPLRMVQLLWEQFRDAISDWISGKLAIGGQDPKAVEAVKYCLPDQSSCDQVAKYQIKQQMPSSITYDISSNFVKKAGPVLLRCIGGVNCNSWYNGTEYPSLSNMTLSRNFIFASPTNTNIQVRCNQTQPNYCTRWNTLPGGGVITSQIFNGTHVFVAMELGDIWSCPVSIRDGCSKFKTYDKKQINKLIWFNNTLFDIQDRTLHRCDVLGNCVNLNTLSSKIVDMSITQGGNVILSLEGGQMYTCPSTRSNSCTLLNTSPSTLFPLHVTSSWIFAVRYLSNDEKYMVWKCQDSVVNTCQPFVTLTSSISSISSGSSGRVFISTTNGVVLSCNVMSWSDQAGNNAECNVYYQTPSLTNIVRPWFDGKDVWMSVELIQNQ